MDTPRPQPPLFGWEPHGISTDQQIRLEAPKLKMSHYNTIVSACILSGRRFDDKSFWTDNDLEEFAEYIKTGKKPEQPKC